MNKVRLKCGIRMVSEFEINASILCDNTSVATAMHKKYCLHSSPHVLNKILNFSLHNSWIQILSYVAERNICSSTLHQELFPIKETCMFNIGDRGSIVVKVLRYKLEGHWFDPRWCHWNFSLT